MRRVALASGTVLVALGIPGTLRVVLYAIWYTRQPAEVRDTTAQIVAAHAALAADLSA